MFEILLFIRQCLLCLSLALNNELDNGTDDNPYAIAEVTRTVRTVQYLGIIIGVLSEFLLCTEFCITLHSMNTCVSMDLSQLYFLLVFLYLMILTPVDDEIPTGLELIGKALEQKREGDKVFPLSKIIFSSILRISIGAMFLTCLFFVLVQENNVLDIFFDMIALEFVESIDDVIYQLCRRGFFSRRLKVAANQGHVLKCSSSRNARRIRKWSKRFIRAIYFSSAIAMVIGLSYITHEQMLGAYGCRSLIMMFGDGVWENAWVMLDKQCSVDADCNNKNQMCYSGDGLCYEKRLLIYSHFNGYYNQNGSVGERPRYVEMNKESGDPFKTTIPAELVYCQDIESWVLTHPKIRTSLNPDKANECNWLMRSGQTEVFDLIELSRTKWFLWKGQIQQGYDLSAQCVEVSRSLV
jgi:hypothetical protein